jgi:hypothetical protein
MPNDFAATISQWNRYRELPFVKMGHYYILSFFFVRGLTTIFLVGGTSIEDL